MFFHAHRKENGKIRRVVLCLCTRGVCGAVWCVYVCLGSHLFSFLSSPQSSPPSLHPYLSSSGLLSFFLRRVRSTSPSPSFLFLCVCKWCILLSLSPSCTQSPSLRRLGLFTQPRGRTRAREGRRRRGKNLLNKGPTAAWCVFFSLVDPSFILLFLTTHTKGIAPLAPTSILPLLLHHHHHHHHSLLVLPLLPLFLCVLCARACGKRRRKRRRNRRCQRRRNRNRKKKNGLHVNTWNCLLHR